MDTVFSVLNNTVRFVVTNQRSRSSKAVVNQPMPYGVANIRIVYSVGA